MSPKKNEVRKEAKNARNKSKKARKSITKGVERDTVILRRKIQLRLKQVVE